VVVGEAGAWMAMSSCTEMALFLAGSVAECRNPCHRAGMDVPDTVPWTARVLTSEPTDALRNHKLTKAGKKITRTMMQTIERWSLVGPGDRLMVAVSGGKDSYTLLDLLLTAQKKAPFAFSVIAVHLDQAQPGYDGKPLEDWLQKSGADFEIVREDTYSIVVDKTKPGQSFCFLCSRLRRGILYSVAERLGCNKIVLGHHRDDGLETMLMNLCYAGKLQAMPARYTTDDGKFLVIRPLIDVAEDDIREFAKERAYPILPCNLCGSQDGLKRDAMSDLLSTLEQKIPNIRAVMHNAIGNVRPSHLLDADVDAVWHARPPNVQPKEVVDVGVRRMTGAIVSHTAPRGTLRILNADVE
jgi:tRNA 2-thiocytidine biosynthesis protein TtcA